MSTASSVREPNLKGSDRRGPRVLMVSPRYLPDQGGIEIHVNEVGRRMAALGVDLTVLTAADVDETTQDESADGFRVIRVPYWPRGRDWRIAPAIGTVVRNGGWDVVHVQSCLTGVAPIAMRAAIRTRTPFVLSVHGAGIHPHRARLALRPIQYRALAPLVKRSAGLIALTQSDVAFYSRELRVPSARFTLAPNGADLPKLDGPLARVDPHRPVVASIGRLDRSKGHHRVVDAMVGVLAVYPEASLWIAGEGPEAGALARQAARLGIAESVEISTIPAIDRQAMARRLGGCSVVVLMSDSEGHPLAALEAAALGRPLVVADSPGLREFARSGHATAVVADDRNATVAAILGALTNGPPGSPGPLPTWDECTEQIISVYHRAIATTDGQRT